MIPIHPYKAGKTKKISEPRTTASVLKQDLNTQQKVQRMLFIGTKQPANFQGIPLYQATKWHLNSEKWWKMR